MADSDIQAILGLTEKSPQIIQRFNASATKFEYVCTGGADYPGRVRGVQVDSTDDDATRAAAIQAKLLE